MENEGNGQPADHKKINHFKISPYCQNNRSQLSKMQKIYFGRQQARREIFCDHLSLLAKMLYFDYFYALKEFYD